MFLMFPFNHPLEEKWESMQAMQNHPLAFEPEMTGCTCRGENNDNN